MPRAATILSHCADCGLGYITEGEYCMVKNEVWEQAWVGRLKPWHALPGQQVLCIGCFEARIGRTMIASDFTDVPINDPHDPNRYKSLRLLDRSLWQTEVPDR